MTTRLDEIKEMLKAIRDYPTDPNHASEDGYPLELCYDEYAYKRMVDSYRDVARAALAKLEESNA